MVQASTIEFQRWFEDYKHANAGLLDSNPEFNRWLELEYVPIAGGWQY